MALDRFVAASGSSMRPSKHTHALHRERPVAQVRDCRHDLAVRVEEVALRDPARPGKGRGALVSSTLPVTLEGSRNGNNRSMATVAELESCDGFTVEAPGGCLGWVEETWLDSAGHPGAFAVRTPDGQRALLLAEAVQAVDPDAQEMFVGPATELLALEAPRIASADATIAATWRASDSHLAPVVAGAHAEPEEPALAAARTATAHRERPLWQTVAFALGCLATLVAFEIGLAYGIAYLVTGQPY
jgi:hypothetical protein